MAPMFLNLDEVLAIHTEMIRRYGGSHGIRDLGLLEAAVVLAVAAGQAGKDAAIAFFRRHTNSEVSE